MLKNSRDGVRLRNWMRESVKLKRNIVLINNQSVIKNVKSHEMLYGYHLNVLNNKDMSITAGPIDRIGNAGLIIYIEGNEKQEELTRLLMRANAPLVYVKTVDTHSSNIMASAVIDYSYANKTSIKNLVHEITNLHKYRVADYIEETENLDLTMKSWRKVWDVVPPPKGRWSRIRKCHPDKNRPRKA